MRATAEGVAQRLRRWGPCVAVTGVGLAEEAGLIHRPATAQQWNDDVGLWALYAPQMRLMAAAAPSAGHVALARLERAGDVRGVVTENPDPLHLEAGARRVVELGGSAGQSRCPACGYTEPLGCLIGMLPVPRCAACGAVLRPEIPQIGQVHDTAAFSRARELLGEGHFVLVAGGLDPSGALAAMIQDCHAPVVRLPHPASGALVALARARLAG